MSTTQQTYPLYAPRYWPTWCGVALWRIVVCLPLCVQYVFGVVFGICIWCIARHRKHVIRMNLRLCYPSYSKRHIARITFLHCINLGLAVIETGLCFWASEQRIRRMHTTEGLDHLARAHHTHDATLLLPAHFTSIALAGRLINSHMPIDAVYFEQKNPVIAYLEQRCFTRVGARPIRHTAYKTILTAPFMHKKPLWLPCDQDYGTLPSVFASFFGCPAATVTTYARLAKYGTVAYMPIAVFRKPFSMHYTVRIHPPLTDMPGSSLLESAAIYNTTIEAMIAQAPTAQYLWSHRRFKTQPNGETPPY